VTLAILDYGMGNLRSVEKALAHVGVDAEITSDSGRVRAAAGLVLPGVGAFPEAMRAVRARGLDELVRERVTAGVPTLGICLGMQLLFESSSEHGGAEGIGVLEGPVAAIGRNGLKLPQIGWNEVAWRRDSPLVSGLQNPSAFYHVHSFAPQPAEGWDVLGTAVYGDEFVSAVERAPVFGVQFHPEKSGPSGLRLLRSFAALTRS
jgi:glutamine amidotransferase